MGRLDLPDKVRDEDHHHWIEDKLEPRVGYMVVSEDGSLAPVTDAKTLAALPEYRQSISPIPGDLLHITLIGHA